MSRRRKQQPKDQLALPLGRNKRLELIGAIDPEALGVKPRQWARVVDLLTQVELCSQRDGCFAYVETLAQRMAAPVGVSKSTLLRAKDVAQEHGLLVVIKRHDGHRQQSNEWKVVWDRIAILAQSTNSLSPEDGLPSVKIDQSVSSDDQGFTSDSSLSTTTSEGSFSGSQTDTPGCQTETPGFQNDTLYIRNSSSSVSSSIRSTRGRPEKSIHERKRRAPALVPAPSVPDQVGNEIRRINGKRRLTREDAELVWKACAISEHLLGENWLQDAIAGVIYARPRKPFAYLFTELSNATTEAGYSFRQLLARTERPTEGWHPHRPSVDLSRRLCSAVGLEDEL